MSFYEDRVLPRVVDWVCSSSEFAKLRGPLLESVNGQVLELGFGSGTNLPFYTSAVEKLYALDPAHLGRRLASERITSVTFPIEFIDYDPATGRIPLGDQSVDHVVTAFTLCTIPDLQETLSEARRVLKPEGILHFLEHGRSPEKRIQTWQDILTPIQKRVAGGCHLNRKFDEILERAGFSIVDLENFYIRGPKVGTYIYLGQAVVHKVTTT